MLPLVSNEEFRVNSEVNLETYSKTNSNFKCLNSSKQWCCWSEIAKLTNEVNFERLSVWTGLKWQFTLLRRGWDLNSSLTQLPVSCANFVIVLDILRVKKVYNNNCWLKKIGHHFWQCWHRDQQTAPLFVF